MSKIQRSLNYIESQVVVSEARGASVGRAKEGEEGLNVGEHLESKQELIAEGSYTIGTNEELVKAEEQHRRFTQNEDVYAALPQSTVQSKANDVVASNQAQIDEIAKLLA